MSASQPAIRPDCALSVWLQNFYTTKVITSDLQNRCSNELLFTAPWCFLLSFVT